MICKTNHLALDVALFDILVCRLGDCALGRVVLQARARGRESVLAIYAFVYAPHLRGSRMMKESPNVLKYVCLCWSWSTV